MQYGLEGRVVVFHSCKGMSDIGSGLRISIVEVASEAALVWCVTSLQEMELPYNPVLTNE